MSKCPNCKVNVQNSNKKCPLCNSIVKNREKNEIAYPKYKIKSEKVYKDIFKSINIALIYAIVAFLVLIVFSIGNKKINIIITTILGLLIPMIIVLRQIISKKINFGNKILMAYIFISTLVVVIDGFTKFHKWSTTYVIPFMTIGITMLFTIIAMFRKKLFREYFGYLIIVFFISFFPIILFAFSLSNHLWTSILTIGYCLLTILIFAIVVNKNFKEEIKKRFHF